MSVCMQMLSSIPILNLGTSFSRLLQTHRGIVSLIVLKESVRQSLMVTSTSLSYAELASKASHQFSKTEN